MTLASPRTDSVGVLPQQDELPGEGAVWPADDGIETEKPDPDALITEPFNPEQISITRKHLVVEQVMRRLDHDEINLAPDFQRNLVWGPTQKSRLIESLLLRIPLPVFYVASDKNDDWDVVDGIQRISTIRDYIRGKFVLRGLEYLSRLNGHQFAELPRRMQRRIHETELLVHVIEHGTPEEVKFNVFTRINTGGAPLNAQEIRHALIRGPARAFLKQLAEAEAFQRATCGSINSTRMQDRECVLRFLAFFMDSWERYETSNLDAYLRQTMTKLSASTGPERETLCAEFNSAMDAAHRIFDEHAFRKVGRDGRRRPINRALFETWSVELARRSESEIETLWNRRKQLMDAFISRLEDDVEFERSISVGTGSHLRVKRRFSTVRELVAGCLS